MIAKILRMIALSATIICLLIMIVGLGHSYNTGEGGHRGLAEKSLKLKKSLHAGEELDKELTIELIDGIKVATAAEDDITWQQTKSEIFPPWMRHFYDPTTGKGLPYFENAKFRAARVYKGAVDAYCSGNKQKAWELLGHVLHLLQDMGSPSHVHNASHVFPFLSSWGFENYVSNNWSKLEPQIVAQDCELEGSTDSYIEEMASYTYRYKYDYEYFIPGNPPIYVPVPVTKGQDPYPDPPYNTTALLNQVTCFSAGLIDSLWNAVQKCSQKPPRPTPGGDNPDDTYAVSVPLEFGIDEAEYQWMNMRLAMKKGRIGYYWAYLYGNKYQEIPNLPANTTNDVIAQKFIEVKTFEDLLNNYPYNETEDSSAAPDVAVLSEGFAEDAVRLLFRVCL